MNLQNKMRLGCQRKLLHFGTMEYYHVLNTNTLKSTVVETDTLCVNNVNVTDTITSNASVQGQIDDLKKQVDKMREQVMWCADTLEKIVK